MDPKDWLTLGIAGYGAVLSTYNLVQAVRKERRRVRISMITACYTPPSSLRLGKPIIGTQSLTRKQPAILNLPLIEVEVTNIGHRPVVVNLPCLTIGKETLSLTAGDEADEFPKKLEDGQTGSVWISYFKVAEKLRQGGYSGTVRLGAVCTDTVGREYRAKPWKFDVDEVTSMREDDLFKDAIVEEERRAKEELERWAKRSGVRV